MSTTIFFGIVFWFSFFLFMAAVIPRKKAPMATPMATPKANQVVEVEGRVISFFDGLSEKELCRLSKPTYLRLDKGELPKGFPFA